MRKICMLLLLAITSYGALAQIVADPATGQMDIKSLAGVSQNANFLAPNGVVSLTIPLYNLSQTTAVPTGSCLIKIRLGTKLILAPGFNLSTAPLSNYFSWSAATIAGEVVITGNQIAPLPADFADFAQFNVQGASLGTSEIVIQLFISEMTDEDNDNNTATLQYTVTNTTIPVTFTGLYLSKTNCTVTAKFLTEQEINVKKYEVEAALNGPLYKKVGELMAEGNKWYQFSFDIAASQKDKTILVRIKSVDHDGQVKYSEAKPIKGGCGNAAASYQVFPNPINGQRHLNITTTGSSLLNGHYQMLLTDAVGKLLHQHHTYFTNTTRAQYPVPQQLQAGTYLLTIIGGQTSSPTVVKLSVL